MNTLSTQFLKFASERGWAARKWLAYDYDLTGVRYPESGLVAVGMCKGSDPHTQWSLCVRVCVVANNQW